LKKVEKDIFPLEGAIKSVQLAFDVSKTDKTFSTKFKSFGDKIVDIAGYFAALEA